MIRSSFRTSVLLSLCESERMGSDTEHILMIPFMAQGHLRPFTELALRLHARTQFTITLLTTPLNAQLLRRNLTPTATSAVHVVDLPFNSSDHGLPAGVENTDKVPLSLLISLFHSTKSLEPHLRNFISTHFSPHRPPLCIIFDVLLGWVDPVARSFGSTGIAFTTCGAYGSAAFLSIWNDLPHRNFPDDEDFPLPGFPETHRFRRSQLHGFLKLADGSDDWSLFFQPSLRSSMKCPGLICNSVEEVEPLGFQILRNYTKLPIWGIGPLIPEPVKYSSSSSDECIQWLDSQKKPDSVLYISFGSQNTISPTQMMELAKGLELSGKPFLWVIRPPFGFDINGELRPEWLPEGFEDRMKKNQQQGILVHKWGPQMEILNHESTGAFLSHCGWNSVLEGLREGVPLITWPLAAEQAYNSKMLVEEMRVAVELTRGLEGKVSENEVKRAVDLMLEREEGSGGWDMKKKAVEAGKKIKDAAGFKGSSIKAMDDFVDAIVSGRFK